MMPELKSGVSANFTNGAKREGVTNLWKDSGVPSTRELFFFLLTTWNRTCWNTETTLSVCVLYTECCSSSVFSHTEPLNRIELLSAVYKTDALPLS